MKLPDVSAILKGEPGILPSIDRIIIELDRNLKHARSDEVKLDYLDLAMKRLDEARVRSEQTVNELQEKGLLDNPEPYWLFRTELRNLMNDLSIIRETIRIGNVNMSLPKQHGQTEETDIPAFTSAQITPEVSIQSISLPVNEVMTIDEFAAYTKWSKSWIYKHYKELGIPHTMTGGLRFLKASVDDYLKSQEKKPRNQKSDINARFCN